MVFNWHLDESPPIIESHSKAKLKVLRSYLRAYFDRLNVNPVREDFKLDLIDGFSGGGVFLDGLTEISGTPLVMLEETEQARIRLNRNRKKKLHIDCKFYFIDKKEAHTNYLQKTLLERGYLVGNDKLVIRNDRFENEVRNILKSIQKRQPRAGRAIFLLDQKGFSGVELSIISRIFRELPNAEVILTFAADALVNHLSDRPETAKMVMPLQLQSRVPDLIEMKEGNGGRALVQRTLRDHIRMATGAMYDTPFFIRPRQSRRALWFLHLSMHPIARDVMTQQHWNNQNIFEHYGQGDFGFLGWDALVDSDTIPLFQFRDLDKREMKKGLLESLPKELYRLVYEQPVTMDALRHTLANRTAARFSDLDEVIVELHKEREIEIRNPEGKRRAMTVRHLASTDRVALPSTQLLLGLSRRS